MRPMLSLPTDAEVVKVKKELAGAMQRAVNELQTHNSVKAVIEKGTHKVMGTAFWDEVVELTKSKGAKIKGYTIGEPCGLNNDERHVVLKFSPSSYNKAQEPKMSFFISMEQNNFHTILHWVDKFIPLNERDYQQAKTDYETLDAQVAKYNEIIPQIAALVEQLPNPKNWHTADMLRVCSTLRGLRN